MNMSEVESVREELCERALWRGESSPVWILGDDPPLLGWKGQNRTIHKIYTITLFYSEKLKIKKSKMKLKI